MAKELGNIEANSLGFANTGDLVADAGAIIDSASRKSMAHRGGSAETDEGVERLSIPHGNEQLFASKYKLYLPSEEELRAEIETQKTFFALQQAERSDDELE